MFTHDGTYSTITAMLPDGVATAVADALVAEKGASALLWQARGTLLQDRWWQRWVPPISPAKTMLYMLAPADDVDRLVGTIIDHARLGQQAVGAVYSHRCDSVYLGSEYHAWPATPGASVAPRERLKDDLNVIHCIVGHRLSDRVTRAAINAGAHGPVVYYSEGRGLRDRLGWLRITKEHEQEVFTVMADESHVEQIFDAMAKAGEFHLPGRGLMYRLPVDKGMFNLPSRVSRHHYEASMQQIIHAIDHLQGHTHWRDQAVFDVGTEGKGTGLDCIQPNAPALTDPVCLSAVLRHADSPRLMDMLLDAGAPGLTMHRARIAAAMQCDELAGACVNDEYAMFRCIVDEDTATRVCAALEDGAEAAGVRDLCVTVNRVSRVACYVPGERGYRHSDDDVRERRAAAG